MDICLGLALASSTLVQLPSPLLLSWEHSVEHVRLQEQWQASERGLVLSEATIESPAGAGIDLPADAHRIAGGWSFRPQLPPQSRVELANSRFAGGYRVCWAGGCAKLADLVGGVDRPVTLTVCPS